MSYEAWGEPEDPAFTIDELLEKGWISPDDVTRAQIDVLNERIRQQDDEGWTAEHDDGHTMGEMPLAALCYTMNAIVYAQMRAAGIPVETLAEKSAAAPVPERWPWDKSWWKPAGQRRNLVKAAALIIAEIERLDRAEGKVGAGDHG